MDKRRSGTREGMECTVLTATAQPDETTGAVLEKIPYTAPVCVRLNSKTGLCLFRSGSTLFSDSGLLTGEFAQVVQFSATNLTDFVHGNAVDARAVDGEDTLYTHGTGHLAHGETLVMTMTCDFDNNAAIQLYALFVTLDDFVCYGYGVAGFECGIRFTGSKCFFCNFD